MTRLRVVIMLIGVCVMTGMSSADVVTYWNRIANIASQRNDEVSIPASRALAIVHVSVYDAVNAFYHDYEPYRVEVKPPRHASPEAAAAAAAWRALVYLYPDQKPGLDEALKASLDAISASEAAKKAGVEVGIYVADRIIAWRSRDNSDEFVPYTPGDDPGEWRPTPPNFTPALFTQWPYVKPFVIRSPRQYLPPPPPSLQSPEYTAAFNEVKAIGALDSDVRTPEQTEIGLFWAEAPGTESSVSLWNRFARQVSRRESVSLEDNARLFALLNMAMADTIIAVWYCKYTYNFWRPITAIREADEDGNRHTIADPEWVPLVVTPAFPEYVSGHASFSEAAATILDDFFGDSARFHGRSHTDPSVIRYYDSFSEAAHEAGISRIYAGIHFRFSFQVGRKLGSNVGQYVWANSLQPTGDCDRQD